MFALEEVGGTKFIYWSPNPQYLKIWQCLEKGPLKRWLSWNEDVRVGPHPIWLLPLEGEIWTPRDTKSPRAQRSDHVRTKQHEGDHLQAKEKGLNRSFPCGPQRKPNLPAPRSWTQIQPPDSEKINVCCLSHQSVVCCYGSPSKQIHGIFFIFKDLEFVAYVL